MRPGIYKPQPLDPRFPEAGDLVRRIHEDPGLLDTLSGGDLLLVALGLGLGRMESTRVGEADVPTFHFRGEAVLPQIFTKGQERAVREAIRTDLWLRGTIEPEAVEVHTMIADFSFADQNIPRLTLVADRTCREMDVGPVSGRLEAWSGTMDREAARVVTAMFNTMPQGLTDRILARMMQAKATTLALPANSEQMERAKTERELRQARIRIDELVDELELLRETRRED